MNMKTSQKAEFYTKVTRGITESNEIKFTKVNCEPDL